MKVKYYYLIYFNFNLDLDYMKIMRFKGENKTPDISSKCPKELEELMKECWKFKKEERPSIDSIIETLESLSLIYNVKIKF